MSYTQIVVCDLCEGEIEDSEYVTLSGTLEHVEVREGDHVSIPVVEPVSDIGHNPISKVLREGSNLESHFHTDCFRNAIQGRFSNSPDSS